MDEPNVHLDEPNVHLNEPNVHLNEPNVHLDEPYVHLDEPYVHLDEPYVHLDEPNVHLNEPYVHLDEPNVHLDESLSVNHLLAESYFEATCRQNLAPIVAAARCLVSEMGRQRLQRIAGRTMMREEDIGSLNELRIIN